MKNNNKMSNNMAALIIVVVCILLAILRVCIFPSPRYNINRDKENAYTEYLKKNNINQKGN